MLVQLATNLEKGNDGFRQNHDYAQKCYEIAAKNDHPIGLWKYGQATLKRANISIAQFTQAKNNIIRAANKGVSAALIFVAKHDLAPLTDNERKKLAQGLKNQYKTFINRYKSNHNDTKALDHALALLRLGIKIESKVNTTDFTYTAINLAVYFQEAKNGLPRDLTKTFEINQYLVEKTQDPIALWNLAVCYRKGFGVTKNLNEANRHTEESAKKGFSAALFYIYDTKLRPLSEPEKKILLNYPEIFNNNASEDFQYKKKEVDLNIIAKALYTILTKGDHRQQHIKTIVSMSRVIYQCFSDKKIPLSTNKATTFAQHLQTHFKNINVPPNCYSQFGPQFFNQCINEWRDTYTATSSDAVPTYMATSSHYSF